MNWPSTRGEGRGMNEKETTGASGSGRPGADPASGSRGREREWVLEATSDREVVRPALLWDPGLVDDPASFDFLVAGQAGDFAGDWGENVIAGRCRPGVIDGIFEAA